MAEVSECTEQLVVQLTAPRSKFPLLRLQSRICTQLYRSQAVYASGS